MPDPTLRRAPGVVTRRVAGELVLVCTAAPSDASVQRQAGDFFVLNPTAELLWEALSEHEGCSRDDLARRLIDEWEIPHERALVDVDAFLDVARVYGVIVPGEMK